MTFDQLATIVVICSITGKWPVWNVRHMILVPWCNVLVNYVFSNSINNVNTNNYCDEK